MSVDDVLYIQKSFNVWLGGEFSGAIHWDGVENPDDAAWIEPWIDLTYDLTRPRERVFGLTVTVNCFAKRNQTPQNVSTYQAADLASEVAELLRNASFAVARYGLDEKVIGCGRFRDPEVTNLGTTNIGQTGAGIPLQQWNVTAPGSVAPLA